MKQSLRSLAETITRKSSLQTYLTIKLLVDKPLRQDCFKAYAYFRWLDDQIDVGCTTTTERLRCIGRQKRIIEAGYQGSRSIPACPEEQLIIELIQTDRRKQSKLGSFILHFLAIIEFDVGRKGKQISQAELTWYTKTLAQAVTDGIEHFINHTFTYPDSPHHYDAAIGAHLTHMLRDYYEDIPEGYFNISKEFLEKTPAGSYNRRFKKTPDMGEATGA